MSSRRRLIAKLVAAPDAPVACTLARVDLAKRAAEFRAAFAELVATHRFDGGFRWTFRNHEGFADELRSLAEREHACCQFMTIDISITGEHVVWESRGSEQAQGALDVFFGLPRILQTAG